MKTIHIMANQFDKIFKEESEILIKAIATKVLGIKDFDNTQPVTASLQKTLEREPDWLRKVCHPNPKDNYIFHGEVHGKDEAVILDRNLVYFSLLWSSFHLPVRQVVIYVGRKKKPTNLKSNLTLPNITYFIEIINLHEVPYDLFIHADKPEEVILSILCDFKGQNPEIIIAQILTRLKILDGSGLKLEKHLVQLEIISDLRNLQPLLTKIMETMPIIYDIRRDIRYKQGKLEGKLEGKSEQDLVLKQLFVIRLLQKGIESVETISEFADVTSDFVNATKSSYEEALILIANGKKTSQYITDTTGLKLEVVEKLKKD